MTTNEFRSIALGFPDVEEKSHFDHPDFRVRGKIFATLGYPKNGWGMVRLTPKQQKEFILLDPEAFLLIKGVWGLRGATNVHLRLAKKRMVKDALIAAWRNVAPKSLTQRIDLQ